MSTFPYALGALRDPAAGRHQAPSFRLLQKLLPQGAADPPMLALRPHAEFTPIRDQAIYPECVTFATFALKEWMHKRLFGRDVDLSEMHGYKASKCLDGLPDVAGTYPLAAFDVLARVGTCHEEDFPYTAQNWAMAYSTFQTDAMYRLAEGEYRFGTIARVDSPWDGNTRISPTLLQQAVVNGPVYLTTQVDQCWDRIPGLVYYADQPEALHVYGFHGVLVTGYRRCISRADVLGGRFHDPAAPLAPDTPKNWWWEFRNSWGTLWGLDGWGYMTEEYRREWTGDYWTATEDTAHKLIGDLTGDNRLSVEDVTSLVRLVLRQQVLGDAQGLLPLADVNADGQVSIADVVRGVQVMLGGKG